jgi:hypothetical protein
MESLMREMKQMRQSGQQLGAIAEHFVKNGVDRKSVAESFVTAFGFERNPQVKMRILSHEQESWEDFNKIAERRLIQRKFGQTPSLEEIATFYGVTEEKLKQELEQQGLEKKIVPIGRWEAGKGNWHGFTVDAEGLMALDEVFADPSGQRASYWSW